MVIGYKVYPYSFCKHLFQIIFKGSSDAKGNIEDRVSVKVVLGKELECEKEKMRKNKEVYCFRLKVGALLSDIASLFNVQTCCVKGFFKIFPFREEVNDST